MKHTRLSGHSFLLVCFIGVVLSPFTLRAQTYNVTTSLGDLSANSLGWAVTSLNGADGTININNGPSPITLLQVLGAIGSSNVTLQGQDLDLTGESSAQAQFLFSGTFNQQANWVLHNDGALGSGLDVAVTANSWTMGPGNYADLYAGSGAATVVTGGSGVLGMAGGSVSIDANFFTVGQGVILQAGNGGSVTDNGGSSDLGGQGGSVFLTGTSLVMPGNFFQVNGGAGGSVTDLGAGTGHQGGDGGSAWVSFGVISSGPYGILQVQGGKGGTGITGGDGGAATAITGQLFLTQGFVVQGGDGGNGTQVSGNGGSAFASIGTYSGSGSSNFKVAGGSGGAGPDAAGSGGDARLIGGSVTVNGPNSSFQVLGGNGGNLGPILSGSAGNGGDGGAASVSLTDFIILSASTFNVSGGSGGQGTSGLVGNGGAGGDTTFNLGTLTMGTSTVLGLSSGSGGSGGNDTGSGTGGQGGDGGNLAVTLGSLNIGSGSVLDLSGGTGGGGGNSTGGTGGQGGAGGDVSLSIGAVTLASGNILNISGGAGGTGGTGAVTGASGVNGQVAVVFGDLEGLGQVNLNGTASLAVSQGNYGGSLSGTEDLVKDGSATLTLFGSNYYTGGTSILGGVLLVGTGGTLGSGGVVQVTNGTLLSYIGSANASGTSIVGQAGATILFGNNASAGSASILNNGILAFGGNSSAGSSHLTGSSGSTLSFNGNSLGGTASVDVLLGGVVDMGSHSGGLTFGSLSGNGLVVLGSNGLTDGSNGLDSTFSGSISGTGSLTKIGSGTLTLASANIYTGGTWNLGGTMALGDAGALGSGSLLNSAVLMTDGSPLTVQVGGDFTQTSTGTLSLGLGGPLAVNGDALTVAGSVTLDGTLDLFAYSGLTAPARGATQVLIAAGVSVTGAFQQVNESLTGVRFLPVYLANAVELMSINPSFKASGTTSNQSAIGADMDRVALVPSMNALMFREGPLSDAALRDDMTRIDPSDLSAWYSLAFQGAASRADLLDLRLTQSVREGARAAGLPGLSWGSPALFASTLSPAQERSMSGQDGPWKGTFAVNGGVMEVLGDGNAAGYKTTSFGLTAGGGELRLSRDASAGIVLGYQHGDATLGSDGTLTDDGGQIGLYGVYSEEGFYFGALGEAGLHSYRTQRATLNGTASGSTQGWMIDGSLELGYSLRQAQVQGGPFVSLQEASLQVNAFKESGSLAPLYYGAQSGDSLMGSVGLQASGDLKMGGATLAPSVKAAYEHEFDFQGGAVQAGFGTGDSFTVDGPRVGPDGFRVGAGLDLALKGGLDIALDYQGDLGRLGFTSHRIDLGTRFGF